MYKIGFGMNNLTWWMCHKIKPIQTKQNGYSSLTSKEEPKYDLVTYFATKAKDF